MKRVAVLVAAILFMAGSAEAGIYRTATSSQGGEDSIAITFVVKDSVANPITGVTGDSIFIAVFHPGGALAVRDSGRLINSTTATGKLSSAAWRGGTGVFTVYCYATQVSVAAGTTRPGVYPYVLTIRDSSCCVAGGGVMYTFKEGEAQVYTSTTHTFATNQDSATYLATVKAAAIDSASLGLATTAATGASAIGWAVLNKPFVASYTAGSMGDSLNNWNPTWVNNAATRILLALPAFAPAASGGLPTYGTGTGQINVDGAGNVKGDVTKWLTGTPLALTGDGAVVSALDSTTTTGGAGTVDAVEMKAVAWEAGTRVLTAGTNIALAKGVGLTGLNDIAATAVVSGGAITTSGGAVTTVTTTGTATALGAGAVNATSVADGTIDSATFANDAKKMIAIRADSGTAKTVGSINSGVIDSADFANDAKTMIAKRADSSGAGAWAYTSRTLTALGLRDDTLSIRVKADTKAMRDSLQYLMTLKAVNDSNLARLFTRLAYRDSVQIKAIRDSAQYAAAASKAVRDSMQYMMTLKAVNDSNLARLVMRLTYRDSTQTKAIRDSMQYAAQVGTVSDADAGKIADSVAKHSANASLPDTTIGGALRELHDSLDTQGWAATGSSTGADSGVVARIQKRMWGALGSGSDSLTVAQRTVTGGGTGTGAIACSLYVKTGATAIQGTRLFIYNSGLTSVLYTNSIAGSDVNGRSIFGLDPSTTYKILAARTGYSYDSLATYQTVVTPGSGKLIDTIPMTAISPGTPSAANVCRVSGTLRTPAGIAVSGAIVDLTLNMLVIDSMAVDGTTLTSLSRYGANTVTDSLGNWSLDRIPNPLIYPAGSVYLYTAKLGSSYIPGHNRRVTVPNVASVRIEAIR